MEVGLLLSSSFKVQKYLHFIHWGSEAQRIVTCIKLVTSRCTVYFVVSLPILILEHTTMKHGEIGFVHF